MGTGRSFVGCIGILLSVACSGVHVGDGQVVPRVDVAAGGPVPVEIRGTKGAYQLYRDGEAYDVRGVGIGVDHPDGFTLIRELAEQGGNSFRTWHVVDRKFLDYAHGLGVTVAVCLDVQRERHGFDYDDGQAVERQLRLFEAQVRELKDHPALLFWIVGNELNHEATNYKVYDAVNDIAAMIHEVDPNHPVTTTTAGISPDLAKAILARAPELDFLSIQVYGGLFDLKPVLDEINDELDFNLPLVVSEWGTIGHWEVDQTSWGAPLELNSREKADVYEKGFEDVLSTLKGDLIGNYAFLWAQKQERTPTWYGMFTDRLERTPSVDVMHKLWNGRWPADRAPRIDRLTLNDRPGEDSVSVLPGSVNIANAPVNDETPDELTYRWVVMPESTATQSGGDLEEIPPELDGLTEHVGRDSARITAPTKPGAYRLYVYIQDAEGAAAHANLPFYVEEVH